MLTRGRIGVFALSILSVVSLACDEDATSSGGGGSGAGDGGGGAGGGEPLTHDAWSLTEAFSVGLAEVAQARALVPAGDGHFFVGGYDFDFAGVVVRVDAQGEVVPGWPVAVSTPDGFQGGALFVTALPDGSAVTAVPGASEWLLSRIAPDGSEQWTASYATEQNEYGMDLTVTASGGVALLTTQLGAGLANRCRLAPFDAAGVPQPVYLAPNEAGDDGQIVRCTGATLDAGTGELVVLGYAAVDVAWSAVPIERPSLHRVSADLASGTTSRDVHSGNTLVGSFSSQGATTVPRIVVDEDGGVFVNEWTGVDSRDVHPISLQVRVSADTPVDRWEASRARLLPLRTAPHALLARQLMTSAPIEISVVDTSFAEPFPLASASFEPGADGMITDVRVQGDAVWVLWQASSVPGPRVRLTRYDAATTVAEGPGPEPELPVATQAITELANVDATAVSGDVARAVASPDGGLYVLTRDGTSWAVARLDASGQPASGSWPHTFMFPSFTPDLDTPAHPDIAVFSDGSLVVATVGQFGWVTRRLHLDGSTDWEAEYDSGPEDYPAGVLVDAEDRVFVYGSPGSYRGTPHVDCWALRYSAGGDLDDAFEVAVTEGSAPKITECRAGVFNGARGELVLVGRSSLEHPLLGVVQGRGLARIGDTGSVVAGGALDGDLFGPVLGSYFSRPVVTEGNLQALGDGTLVAAVSRSQGSHNASRVTALSAAGDALTQGDWAVGTQHVAALSNGLIAIVHHTSTAHPYRVTVNEPTPDGLASRGSLEVAQDAGWGGVLAVTAGPDATFWLALRESPYRDTLKRFRVSPR